MKVIVIGFGNLSRAFVRILSEIKRGRVLKTLFPIIGDYKLSDIEIVAIFDIRKSVVNRKVIDFFDNPSPDIAQVEIFPGILLDSVPKSLQRKITTHTIDLDQFESFLDDKKADIAILAINSFAKKSAEFYAKTLAKKGISLINTTPINLASNKQITRLFEQYGVGIVGDYLRGYFDPWTLKAILSEQLEKLGLPITEFFEREFEGGLNGGSLIGKERYMLIDKIQKLTKMLFPQAENVAYSYDWYTFLNDYRLYQAVVHVCDPLGESIEINISMRWNSSTLSALILFDVLRALKLAIDNGYRGRINEICEYGFLFTGKTEGVRSFLEILNAFRTFIAKFS